MNKLKESFDFSKVGDCTVEIDPRRVDNVSDVLSEGDIIKVKLIGFDRGKMKLSKKALET